MFNHRFPSTKLTVLSTNKGNTPEKYQRRKGSNHHSSRKLLFSRNSQSNKTYDSEDLLLLEINLLKKQNNFLKKKINDLNKEKQELLLQGFGLGPAPKKSYPNKGKPKDNREAIQISVDYFFMQINNLILSLADVFHMSLDEVEEAQFKARNNQITHKKVLKSPIITKKSIHQQLQQILLDSQQKRYKQLLNLFTDYYRVNTIASKQTAQYVDSLTKQIIQLNKWMFNKIHSNKLKKKSQTSQSNNQKDILEEKKLINQLSQPIIVFQKKNLLV